ncbi:MAG: DUF3617 domain-containing protein [Xanthomonadaceae bacterium]|nr:DUF3617 domain-containing protein [Xanthomonadaceae bacterium]
MNKRLVCAGFGLCGLLLASTGAVAMEVKTGLWESHIETEIEGLPVSPPPMTHRNCVTEEDLVPQMQSPGQECEVLEHSTSGKTVTWRVQCKQDGMTMTGHGKIVYSGERYEGNVVMTMDGGPMGPMKMTQTMTGRRIGDCP